MNERWAANEDAISELDNCTSALVVLRQILLLIPAVWRGPRWADHCRCEGATTPVVKTITSRARLTPSELGVAVQAAAGRSNKQIAADSHVSVRTVETHLQRVYEKLGISSRRQLGDALRDRAGV
jgi:DNA-binding NarL/FixJ family response regulator